MLNIYNIGVSFSGTSLFEGVSFKLDAGDRVGLIGKNGAGKSTLLKILSRELEPDTGSIASDKEIKIGFLKQDIDFEKGRTVLDETYQAFTEIREVEAEIDFLNNELGSRTDYESEEYSDLIVRLSDLTHRFEIVGGYNYVGDTEKVLLGLGFKREEFGNLTESFSGGWRMRIELAKLLLQNNEVLLLDEPTNHLDIESIIWLEQFLKSYPGVVVIVSHDKMFLDNVTNRTIEISLGKIYDFNKPYTDYLELREELREQQLATQKNQAKKIEETEKLIERFRYKASKAAMAQSLIKKLDKIERVEVDEEESSVMKISFPISITPGKVVLELKDVGKKFGEKSIFKGLSFLIERGKKIAFVGQNGQGKSTLIKAIMNEFEYEGDIKLGHNVQLGYFAQNQAEYLDGEKTILDTMLNAANDTNRVKVRDMLGAFLFRGDDVEKKVKVLSGGERNRLALCKMLLEPINVLLLDEPTNHLDIKSKTVLKEALKSFEGTLIVVSHDRDFLQGLTDIVYEFKEGGIKEYLGDINYFLEERNVQHMREIEKNNSNSLPGDRKEKVKTKVKAKSFEEQKKQKALSNKLRKIENDISELEKRISKEDEKLATDYENTVSEESFFRNYQECKDRLEKLMLQWEKIHEEIENES